MTRTPRTMALRLLAVPTAAALLATAWIHLDLSSGYDAIGTQVTQGDLFRAQAAVAAAAALWLLVRPTRLGWWFAAAVAAGSLLAVVGTVYVDVPALGPLPHLHEPVWYAEKAQAAVAAGVALLLALPGSLLRRPVSEL